MANNPYVNKVEKADGTPLMDITDTTAEANDVESGRVFYAASGARTVGTGSGGSSKLDQVAAYALYSESETYAVDDIVTINSRVWQCTVPIETPEEWTESHWTETTIGSIIEESAVTYNDFTGATASTAGTHGLVPAPVAGEENKILAGDGSWKYLTTASYTYDLDTVTNTSGSYSHATTISGVTADMKAYMIELGTPSVFKDTITITCADGSITLACNSVEGTSTVKVTVQKQVSGSSQTITSAEFDTLAGRIGTLSSLTTTDKTSLVAAANEIKAAIPGVVNALNSDSTTSALSAAQGKALNTKFTSQDIGTASTKAQLDTLLDTLLGSTESNGVVSFKFVTSAAFDVFYNSMVYVGTLYKSSTGTTYSHVSMRGIGRTDEITGLRDGNGWSYDAIALNGYTPITSYSDLNSYTNTGHYSCASASVASTLSHCPYAYAGFEMDVMKWEGGSTQIVVSDGRMFFRRTVSNDWTELALNIKMTTQLLGNGSLSNLQSLLVTLNDNLADWQFKNIEYKIDTTESVFHYATYYMGTIKRFSSTRFTVDFSEAYSGERVFGSYKDGTWSWRLVSVTT